MLDEKESPKRVPYSEHPERCLQINRVAGGEQQCQFFREPGQSFCKFHGGMASETLKLESTETSLYRLRKYGKRLQEIKVANSARTLDDELGILRITLEEVVNKFGEEGEVSILLYSTKITELVREIKSVLVAADRLATKAGTLIGRSEAIVIAGRVVEIVSKHITDPGALNRIANEISEAFITVEDEG